MKKKFFGLEMYLVRAIFAAFLLVSIAGWALASHGVVLAQASEIKVASYGAESKFPDGVRFFIEASGPNEIVDIRVVFKKLGQSSRRSYRALEFDQAVEISGETLMRSGTGGEYIPPGTRIEYSFEIKDAAGKEFSTEERVFVYLDEKLECCSVTDGLITVFYQGEEMEERGRIILEIAGITLEKMRPVLGIDPEEPLHIVTYSNYRDMSQALPFRSETTSRNLITQGMAFDEERVLLVLGGQNTFEGTTSHEFTHLLVADAAGRASSRVPSWLNEGLAEYGNVENSDDYDAYLARAIVENTIRPLWHLEAFNGTPEQIIISYGQGKSVVEYMVGTYGDEKMVELIRNLKTTFDIDKALELTYGFDQYGLDSEWRRSLNLEPLPPPQTSRPRAEATLAPEPTPTSPPQVDTRQEPTPVPTVEPTAIPTPELFDDAAEKEPQNASPGCGASALPAGSVGDLAILALLAGPLGMLGLKRCRSVRRPPGF